MSVMTICQAVPEDKMDTQSLRNALNELGFTDSEISEENGLLKIGLDMANADVCFEYDLALCSTPLLVITAKSKHRFPTNVRERLTYLLNGYHRESPVKFILNCDGTVSVQLVVFGELPERKLKEMILQVTVAMNTYLPQLLQTFPS